MADLKICRICLCKGMKVYNYNEYNLKQYYEQILSSNVNYKDGLPHYFCYLCASMLYKFHKFKEKCHMGQKTLRDLAWSGPLTISQIDKHSKILKSSIDIIKISKRVKTINIRNKSTTLQNRETSPKRVLNEVSYDDNVDSNVHGTAKIPIEEETGTIEEVKIDIDNIDVEDIPLPDDDNNEAFIEDSLKTETIDIVDKVEVKDESNHTADINKDTNLESGSEVEFDNIDDDADSSYEEEEVKPIKKKRGKKQKKVKKVNKDVKEKGKKFLVSERKWDYLDPEHWLKITLSEEEALAEFNAKGQHPRYLKVAHKCTDCFKAFSREDMLIRHKIKHSESMGQLECRLCKFRFKRKGKLAEHLTLHFTKYKCLRCEFIGPGKSAVFHNEFHSGVTRTCNYCGEEFRHSSTYYTHLRVKHRSEHVCTLCGASFVSEMGLRKHRKTMHVDAVDTVTNSEEMNTYCEQCDITFETRVAYEQHFLHSAKHSDDFESQLKFSRHEIERARVRKIITQVRRKRTMTTCKLCNKNFTTQVAFLRHHTAEHKDEPLPAIKPSVSYYANIHTRKEGFNCYKCNSTFTTKGACLRHHAEVHRTMRYQYKDEEKHICEICGALLAPNSIMSHLNTHTRAKLYNCSICGLQVHSKSSLNRHELTHTGVKPFGCPLCDKCFTQKCSMQLHYRTYHLKEPYPKRNRKKKTENAQESSELEDIIMKEILKKP